MFTVKSQTPLEIKWNQEVIRVMTELEPEFTQGDAQDICDANQELVITLWKAGGPPDHAARVILNTSLKG